LQQLAKGLSDKEVARSLDISDQTARKHRTNLLRKTGTHNVCALVFKAATSHWIDLAGSLE